MLIFGAKNGILPLLEFFFHLAPSKISPGYALALADKFFLKKDHVFVKMGTFGQK